MADGHDIPSGATTSDYVLVVAVASLALIVTGPGTCAVLTGPRLGSTAFYVAATMAATWNLMIVGIPIVLTVKHWYDQVREDDDEFRSLARVYWQLQLLTLMCACILAPLVLFLYKRG